MSVPLSATGRITVPVVVSSFTHKVRVYCRNPQAAGGTFNINTRATDANDLVWTDALNDLVTTLSRLFDTGAVFQDGFLEHQSGGIWTTLATATPSFTTHLSGTAGAGWGLVVVLRDVNLKKVKIVAVEPRYQTLSHVTTIGALGGGDPGAFATEFTPSHVLTNAPYVWMVSRGNQYLNTAPFVSWTVSSNRRARRRRGLT